MYGWRGSLLGLLLFKWTYLVVGLLFLGFGLAAYLTARPTNPVEIAGSASSYVEATYRGNYLRNELILEGNSTIYTLDKRSFHPTLPDNVWKEGKTHIWVDQDSTAIIAITLYDENDLNPIKYTTAHYDNPSSGMTDAQRGGITAAVIGVIALGVFASWFGLSRFRAIVRPTGEQPMWGPTPVSGSGVGSPPTGGGSGMALSGATCRRTVASGGTALNGESWDPSAWRSASTYELSQRLPSTEHLCPNGGASSTLFELRCRRSARAESPAFGAAGRASSPPNPGCAMKRGAEDPRLHRFP